MVNRFRLTLVLRCRLRLGLSVSAEPGAIEFDWLIVHRFRLTLVRSISVDSWSSGVGRAWRNRGRWCPGHRFRMFSTQSISADPGAIGFGSSVNPPPRGRYSPHKRADQSGRSQAGTPPDLACIKDGEKVASQVRLVLTLHLHTRVRGFHTTISDYDL